MTAEGLIINPMQSGDIPEILALEAGSLSAWSREHLADEMEQRSGFQFVARCMATGRILGVLCGRIAADESEILKLAVAEGERRKGIGSRLLDFALNHCSTAGVKNCFLELRTSNEAAGNLYGKKGFSRVGIRKNYYDGPVEDAIMMRLGLGKQEKVF